MTETLAQETRTVASIIGGRPETEAPGGRLVSTNPADTSDTVAEALLGDASTFVAACRAARDAQAAWADVPAPVRGRAIQQIGRLVESNKEALAAPRHARDRQALRRVARRGAGDHRHLQLLRLGEGRRLYGQTVPSEMPDKQLFTFRTRSAWRRSSPRATSRWPCRPGTSCRRCCAATRSVWKPAEYAPALGEALAELFLHGGLPEGVLNLVQCDGADRVRGARAGARAGPRGQGRLHRLERGRAASSASSAGATCSRPASSSAARTRWW